MGILVLQNHVLLVLVVFTFYLNHTLSFSLPNATLSYRPFLCSPLQSDALLLFKSTFLIGPNPDYLYAYPLNIESWKNDTNCCFWDGVECDEVTGYVIELYLSCIIVVDNIHAYNTLLSLDIFPYLQWLDLSGNDLQGVSQLDVMFSSLKFLRHLDLSDSNISGSIPSSFGNLTQLISLNLSSNHLHGPIPTSLGNLVQLTHLNLYSNYLSGPIPTSFSNLTRLVLLDMSYNELEGPLPSYLFALPSLEYVDLSYNNLYGHIPTSPIKSMDLSYLILSNNNLSGSLNFDVFFNFKQLRVLSLSNNNFSASIYASTNTNISYSLPNLYYLALSGCNQIQFPVFIKYLINLTYLNVSNNQIQGSVPDWIYDVGKYTMERVDLSENSLSSVGHRLRWKNIQFIDLHSNLLQGLLPIPPPTTLYFTVSNNTLSGEISSLICSLNNLRVFDLSNNLFAGSIPPCIGRLTNISVLNLAMNNLHGIIPNTFAKHNRLNSLVLKGNRLTGAVPPSLANCDNLEMLDFGNNMIEDTVPHWLQKLPNLRVLVLRSNKFFGSLNNFKVNVTFPVLRILDLSNNYFTGHFSIMLILNLNAMKKVDEKLEDFNMYIRPSYGYKEYYSLVITVKGLEMEYTKILYTFATIDLSRNKFGGHILESIGKLISLKGLNLSHNFLSGHIPSSIGNMSSLEWLDLSSNELSGQIPIQLADLNFLAMLGLSQNQLCGPIPQGGQLNTFGNDSYKDNLGLCGFPLSSPCRPNRDENKDNLKFEGEGEGELSWEGAYAGCGCGIVFGLSMGYVVFETGSPKWFVRLVERKQVRGRVGKRSKRHRRRRNQSIMFMRSD